MAEREPVGHRPRPIRVKHGWLAVVAAPLALLTGCASPGGGTTPSPTPGTFDADEVVLRLESIGGLVPPDVLVGRLPTVSVYGDGRLITEGPVAAIYPGPALPNLRVQQLSDDQVDKLISQAVDAGVGATTDVGRPPVADAPTTRFSAVTADGPETLDVIALNEADAAGGLTADQREVRQQLRDFVDRLSAATAGAAQPYDAAEIAAIATPWSAGDTSVPAPPAVAWPGPVLPGDPLGNATGVGCVVAAGDAVRTAVGVAPGSAAAARANAATPWTSGGNRWTLRLRPLLPDERGCTDLATVG
jgi:hypothetical protein